MLVDEETSLLPKPDDGVDNENHAEAANGSVLLNASLPVDFPYKLQSSLQTASILVVGRLGPRKLSAAAFSFMFATASAWLIGMGGTTAIDILASVSFTGSKNKYDIGIILQRAFIVLSLFYMPVALLWTFSKPVFKALGQEDDLAGDASKFLVALIPGGLGYIWKIPF